MLALRFLKWFRADLRELFPAHASAEKCMCWSVKLVPVRVLAVAGIAVGGCEPSLFMHGSVLHPCRTKVGFPASQHTKLDGHGHEGCSLHSEAGCTKMGSVVVLAAYSFFPTLTA